MRLLILFMTLIFASPTLFAETQSQIENAYKTGDFNTALSSFLVLEKSHPQHFDVLYNIGNTYFKLGELGEAMTYYYRAARLRPQDKNLRENMSISKDRVVDNVESRFFAGEVLKRGTRLLSINDLFFVFLGFFFLSVLGAIFRHKDFFSRRYMFWHSVCVGAAVFFFSLTFLYYRTEFYGRPAVIIERKVEAKSGPSDTLKTQFFVHEGVRISVVKVVNGWAEIYLNNGFRAWVKEDSYWEI
jgi:tetratricopeptide (TPR) repeat protein